MKKVQFTETELTTLLWVLQGKTATEVKRIIENGGNTIESETVQRLNAISDKLYAVLMREEA